MNALLGLSYSRSKILQQAANNLWEPLFAGDLTVPENTDFFVGWGTLSLINAGLAQAKGRSGLLWWIASLFFGPVATFLIVILDPVRPAIAK
jgi:hypothetical protein